METVDCVLCFIFLFAVPNSVCLSFEWLVLIVWKAVRLISCLHHMFAIHLPTLCRDVFAMFF